MHRALTAFIEKGMVRPSLDAPTTHTAVDLDSALEIGLRKRWSEPREMEERKVSFTSFRSNSNDSGLLGEYVQDYQKH